MPMPLGYETKWIDQPHDHFRFGAEAAAPWPQRYLFNDTFWDGRGELSGGGCLGPILFYTGNEGPIDDFWRLSGFVTDVLAPRLGGLLLFAEERYYGRSVPSDGTPFEYLSTEQVLADYASLLTRVKTSLNASRCPVVAFGGSYGGTLATLLRLTYPSPTPTPNPYPNPSPSPSPSPSPNPNPNLDEKSNEPTYFLPPRVTY